MEVRLDGKVALVTGGSKGMGFAAAKLLASSGADVAILARDPGSLSEARRAIQAQAKTRIEAVACDISKEKDVTRAHSEVIKAFGRIDILVNNAGTAAASVFDAITDDAWQADLDLKLFAVIRMTRLVLPGMMERRWGRVINVVNTSVKAPPARTAPSGVVRSATAALTKVLANEAAPHNVLVNGLACGYFRSSLHENLFLRAGKYATVEEHYKALGTSVPLGRVGMAEEFANVVCFLASDLASYVTGTLINVDGGFCPVQ